MSDNSISSPSYTSSPQSIVEDNNEYKIIFVRWNESEKPLEYLAKQVNAEIKNGYTPIGGITVIDQTIGGTARHDRHVLMTKSPRDIHKHFFVKGMCLMEVNAIKNTQRNLM